jgi:uncharacterized membrane protein YebE (DUF533 family)
MRLAGAAALGTVAYQSGKRHEEQAQVDEQAQAAPAPAAAAPAAAPADDTTAELERLAQLHQQGVLTDEEFSAAKAKALGI